MTSCIRFGFDRDSVTDLQGSVRISTFRYKGGTTTYLEVLDGQRSLYGAELTLAVARGDEYRKMKRMSGEENLFRKHNPPFDVKISAR